MNVNLVYLTNGYNFDVYNSSPLSYFYDIAGKVFRLNKHMIVLYYSDTKLPDEENISVGAFFNEKPSSISITVQLIKVSFPKLNNHHLSNSISYDTNTSTIKNNSLKSHTLSQLSTSTRYSTNIKLKSKTKGKSKGNKDTKKTEEILCQLCGNRPALYYCRRCNEFVCLDCNTKYSEHICHPLLEIENGDYQHCACVYEKEVLNQVTIIQTAFRKTNEWNSIESIRSDYLNEFIAKLQEIDANSDKIATLKVNKNFELNEQTFYTLKQYIFGLLNGDGSIGKKELQQVFTEYNKKEKEMSKLISYVTLEVTKAKYNYKMMNVFASIMGLLDELLSISSKAIKSCSLRSYLLEDLSNFNDDYPMKSLDQFLSSKPLNSSIDSDRLINISNFDDNTNNNIFEKPLFTDFTKHINANIDANLNIDSNTSESPKHGANLYSKRAGDKMILFSPNQTTTSSKLIVNSKQRSSRNEASSPEYPIINLKKTESISNNKTFSRRKSIFKVLFGETNNNQRSSEELINSATINPYSGNPGLKKKKHKKSRINYNSNQFI